MHATEGVLVDDPFGHLLVSRHPVTRGCCASRCDGSDTFRIGFQRPITDLCQDDTRMVCVRISFYRFFL